MMDRDLVANGNRYADADGYEQRAEEVGFTATAVGDHGSFDVMWVPGGWVVVIPSGEVAGRWRFRRFAIRI